MLRGHPSLDSSTITDNPHHGCSGFENGTYLWFRPSGQTPKKELAVTETLCNSEQPSGILLFSHSPCFEQTTLVMPAFDDSGVVGRCLTMDEDHWQSFRRAQTGSVPIKIGRGN